MGRHQDSSIFCVQPFFGPLLFDNTISDARDHCANERSRSTSLYPTKIRKHSLNKILLAAFLSYLRLSIYMAVVSIAIIISFHLKSQPSPLELRMATPLGMIFGSLSLVCLGLGFSNYINTVNKYSRRAAIVQTGWKTQSVSSALLFVSVREGHLCHIESGRICSRYAMRILTVHGTDIVSHCLFHCRRVCSILSDKFKEVLRISYACE